MHNTCIKHGKVLSRRSIHWVDINLAMKIGLKFYQTRSIAIILAYCIPKVVRMEKSSTKKYTCHLFRPPKISLKHDWKRELGSEHAQRPEVGQLSRRFQSNQQIPNPSRERSGRPVVKDDTRSCARWKKNVPFPGDRC